MRWKGGDGAHGRERVKYMKAGDGALGWGGDGGEEPNKSSGSIVP